MSELLFGYNTNGFANHLLEDALTILAQLGYSSVALTIDVHCLNPLDPAEYRRQLPSVRALLPPLRSGAAIETGARFLLNSRQKHQPTLLSQPSVLRDQRLEFLRRTIRIARRLEVPVVSFWSGKPATDEPRELLMDRLVESCRELADEAGDQGVRLAFEPEPGMFIDTMDKFAELFDRVGHAAFGLTLDIGHLHCMGEPIVENVRRWKDDLWNVHIEDMRRGVHEHLMFGEGEIDFPPVLVALKEIGYTGGVHVELSRHSHDAVETARRALQFLRSASGVA